VLVKVVLNTESRDSRSPSSEAEACSQGDGNCPDVPHWGKKEASLS